MTDEVDFLQFASRFQVWISSKKVCTTTITYAIPLYKWRLPGDPYRVLAMTNLYNEKYRYEYSPSETLNNITKLIHMSNNWNVAYFFTNFKYLTRRNRNWRTACRKVREMFYDIEALYREYDYEFPMSNLIVYYKAFAKVYKAWWDLWESLENFEKYFFEPNRLLLKTIVTASIAKEFTK